MVYKTPERESDASERDRAYDAVLEGILDGRLPAGTRLVEASLSRELSLSRTPLREALFLLQREGFVETQLRRGFSVRPLSERGAREIYTIVANLEILAVHESWPQVVSLSKELRAINKRFFTARTTPRHDEIIAGLERQSLADASEAIARNYHEGIAALQSYIRTRAASTNKLHRRGERE